MHFTPQFKTLLTALCATLYYASSLYRIWRFFIGRSNLLVIFAKSSFKGVFCKFSTFLENKVVKSILLHHLGSKLAIVFSLKSLTIISILRLRSIGNPDFGICYPKRKPISPPRNPFSGWIPITKSKSGCHGFSFYRSIG